MKTQTCLYIREDGRILIGEFPNNLDPTDSYCELFIEAAKSAVEVAPEDQDLARAYITMGMHDRGATWEGVKPGVYPIPGIRYEVRRECVECGASEDRDCRGCQHCIFDSSSQHEGPYYKSLAYITEPPSLAKERPDLKKEGQKEPTFAQFLGRVLEEPPAKELQPEDQEDKFADSIRHTLSEIQKGHDEYQDAHIKERSLENAAYFRGKADAYGYAARKIRQCFEWHGKSTISRK